MTRVMAFIDGENLTARYEEMVEAGWRTKSSRIGASAGFRFAHEKGRFVWNPETVQQMYLGDVLGRAHYYSTFVGAIPELEAFSARIGECYAAEWPVNKGFATPKHPIRLIPKVFKKEGRSKKTKSVDINICVDIMEYVKNDALDAIYLVSGDADYRPLIEAVMRAGKRVYVAAFSSGVGNGLANLPDRFIDLDEIYFNGKSELDMLDYTQDMGM